MRKASKRWLLLVLPTVLFGIPMFFAYWSTFDNTEKLIHFLLLRTDDDLDEQTFLAAMKARFPKGTKVRELLVLVDTFKGKCSTENDGKLICSLDIAGTFCVGTKLRIEAKTNASGMIEELNVEKYFVGC